MTCGNRITRHCDQHREDRHGRTDADADRRHDQHCQPDVAPQAGQGEMEVIAAHGL
jgi:hypothetical protein